MVCEILSGKTFGLHNCFCTSEFSARSDTYVSIYLSIYILYICYIYYIYAHNDYDDDVLFVLVEQKMRT